MGNFERSGSVYGAPMQEMLAVIRRRGVTEARVLAAMSRVPRHCFVPRKVRHHAYDDAPLGIGDGQTISQPYMVSVMTRAARVVPGDRVLEVGTGCGYQAAVLAELGAEVYSMEIIPRLAREVRPRLRALGIEHVHLRIGDATRGWPEAAPFAAILVTAAAPKLPRALCDQLAEGGRLIVPVGDDALLQELQVWQRVAGQLELVDTRPVRFVPMVGLIRGGESPSH